MHQINQRRIFTYESFRASVRDVVEHMDDLKSASCGGRVDRAFAERIMLAVTQVNQCRYCDYGHTRAALAAGVSQAEIEAIRHGAFNDLPGDQITALVFAQHYAKTEGHVDPAAWERLTDTYGEAGARDIMAYVRMIRWATCGVIRSMRFSTA